MPVLFEYGREAQTFQSTNAALFTPVDWATEDYVDYHTLSSPKK